MAAEKREQPGPGEARGGVPGDGAGRRERAGGDTGVYPVSGPPSGNPDAQTEDMASFGQGERGAEGREDHGESEVQTIPPEGGGGETSG